MAAAAVLLGFGVAWIERVFAIPKIVVQMFWIVLLFAGLGFAVWAAWGYYRAQRDDEDWD
ncbi:MAG: hypothetical protein ABL996_18545 [Micropepsaceae bacterium]